MTDPTDTDTTEETDSTTDSTDTATESPAGTTDAAGDPAYGSGPANVTDGGAMDFDEERSPAKYLYWGTFAVLLILALVAVVRFYMSASRAISIWIAPDFVPIFQSAFNLAVLFACALGLSVLVRRMRD
jgi:hypothetical protein